MFPSFRQHSPSAPSVRRMFMCLFPTRIKSVGSRAGLIYVFDISFPSLKIIYIISVIISLRRCHTTTFFINIEGLNDVSKFPSTFSVRAVSQTCVCVWKTGGQLVFQGLFTARIKSV